MARRRVPATEPAPAPLGAFRLGVVAGATPGRWVDTWRERFPEAAISLVPVDARHPRRELDAGEADAALVRLPIDREGLSAIPLYEEQPVVVFPADSHLAAADELVVADLAGETLLVPADDVLGVAVPGAVPFAAAAPADTAAAIELVAAGVGVVVAPMSIARVLHRRDVDRRVLADGPVSAIALAWPAARTTPEVEAFVGIVRGRTARSSR